MTRPEVERARVTCPDGLRLHLVTVLRAEGLRDVIYVNDHVPAHVHAFGDGEAKINLMGMGDTPELVWALDMTRAEVRRATRVVSGQQAFLLRRWEEIHG